MHAERHEGRLVRTKSTNRQRRRVANDAERPSPAPHLQRKTQLQRSRTRVSAERALVEVPARPRRGKRDASGGLILPEAEARFRPVA